MRTVLIFAFVLFLIATTFVESKKKVVKPPVAEQASAEAEESEPPAKTPSKAQKNKQKVVKPPVVEESSEVEVEESEPQTKKPPKGQKNKNKPEVSELPTKKASKLQNVKDKAVQVKGKVVQKLKDAKNYIQKALSPDQLAEAYFKQQPLCKKDKNCAKITDKKVICNERCIVHCKNDGDCPKGLKCNQKYWTKNFCFKALEQAKPENTEAEED